jgi:RNA polymerase sigma factor (sigma-70 family)
MEPTTHNRNAVLVSRYEMEPAVLCEIERIERLSPSQQLAALSENDRARKVSEETLTHFLRAANTVGSSSVAGVIMNTIIRRVSGRLARMAQIWRLSYPPDLLEDVIDDILTQIYDAILNTNSEERFWEVRFWVCFNRLATSALKRRRRELDIVIEEEGGDNEGESILDRLTQPERNGCIQPEMSAIIKDALTALEEPIRTAFLLRHWSGYSVAAQSDNAPPSISSIMGVSDRTVRNYLTKAEKVLKEWRGEERSYG